MAAESGQETSRVRRVISKLPVVGQRQADKARRIAQEEYFSSLTEETYLDQEPTVGGYFKSIAPSKLDVIYYIADTFPCSKWLFNYNLQWFLGDLVAGITVGAVVIPQGMAYAKLADLPVQYGLYTSFFGALSYWVFGTSKDISIGPVAVASLVTGGIIGDVITEHPGAHKETIAAVVAILAGALLCGIGLLRLGWLVDLISLSAVSAFITGSALTITFSQLPILLGIRGVSSRDPAFRVGINVVKHLDRISIDAAFGLSALVLLYLIKWGCTWLAKKRPHLSKTIFFVSTLRTVLTLLIYTLASYLVNRNRREDPLIRILRHIPRGLHAGTNISLDTKILNTLAGQIPAAAIVLIIEHISIAKSFGRLNNYTINPNSELIAIGVTNLIGPIVGAFAATGSFSRTAINSKAGSRTPLAGVITAAVVLLALYALTPMFFYVPQAGLAAVIIHAIGDLITPPSTLYEFWKISPLDVVIFVIGLSITIFESIEHGIFAMIGLSLGILLFRLFKAQGAFLGRIRIRTVHHTKGFSESEADGDADSRTAFLPLDRRDGSNPAISIERPYPGIFIYRFTEGFNFPNANHHVDYMVSVITAETRPTTLTTFTKLGDRPWNDNTPRHGKEETLDDRPTLKAVILDFSAVNNLDLTSVQTLLDVRGQLDRHAAPRAVQWHFAAIQNRWAKRALAAVGFGLPSFDAEDGRPHVFKPVYSLAEMEGAADESFFAADRVRDFATTNATAAAKGKAPKIGGVLDDVELGDVTTQAETIGEVERVESRHQRAGDPRLDGSEARLAALHGINRPFFHPDVQSALTSAIATEQLYEAIGTESPGRGIVERREIRGNDGEK